MKYWKIENKTKESIKFICKTSPSSSKGILLGPNEFCIVEPQATASMQAQERRKFIEIDRNFDNSKLNLEFSISYTEEKLLIEEKRSKSIFEVAQEKAEKYIKEEN